MYLTVIASVIWILTGFASLMWNLFDDARERRDLALQVARSFFSQLTVVRSWNSDHGGVYVAVSETVQPNLYLQGPHRDLTTLEGIKLTKINPEYMTRQISEIAARRNGIQFSSTSLRPIRPGNKADPWEEKRLKSFQDGNTEFGEFVRRENRTFFRYMAPLRMESSCMACHRAQGYKEGDIGGGISIILPLEFHGFAWVMWISHIAAALAGLAVILASGFLIDQSRIQLVDVNEQLEKSMYRFTNIIEDVLELSRVSSPNLQITVFDDWLDEILRTFNFPKGVDVQSELQATGKKANLDRQGFKRAIINLLENACQAMLETRLDQKHEMQLKISTRSAKGQLIVIIENSGPGIDEGVLQQVFNPLFTTKSFGAGLGLPLVKRILKVHQGAVEITNRASPPGVTVTLSIPTSTS